MILLKPYGLYPQSRFSGIILPVIPAQAGIQSSGYLLSQV